MTSAPVKDVNSLLNFVNAPSSKANTGKSLDTGFGEMMNRAKGENTQPEPVRQGANVKQTITQGREENVQNSPKPERTEPRKATEQVTDEQSKAIEEKSGELVKQIAKELDVTEEEVTTAMEEMGITPMTLWNPDVMSQLVLKLSGEGDATAMLTNETLFQNLQNVMQIAEGLQQELMKEYDISPEDFKELLLQAQSTEANAVQSPDFVTAEDAETSTLTQENKITISVEVNGDQVNLSADENGNTTGVQNVISGEKQKEDSNPQEQKGQENGNEGHSETFLHSDNLMLQSLLQNKVSATEADFTSTNAMLTQQNQDIMDQIMDYMKIQVKPDMDHVEMQLHPENLGTVQIHLTSKAGEVTAEFHVQNEAVRNAIESQIVELKDSLKEQGVKVEAVEVMVDTKGFESNLWQGNENQNNEQTGGNKRTPRRINLNMMEELPEEISEEDALTTEMMKANGNTVDYTA